MKIYQVLDVTIQTKEAYPCYSCWKSIFVNQKLDNKDVRQRHRRMRKNSSHQKRVKTRKHDKIFKKKE